MNGRTYRVKKAGFFETIATTLDEGRSEYHTIAPISGGVSFLVHGDDPDKGSYSYYYLLEDGDQRDIVTFMRSGLYVFAPETLGQFLDHWVLGLFVQCSLIHYQDRLIVVAIRLHGDAG